MEYSTINEYIKAINKISNEDIYIVGAGVFGKFLSKYLDKYSIPYKGYIDKNTSIGSINGKNVCPYDKCRSGNAYYLVSTYKFKDEIIRELNSLGIENDMIITYDNYLVIYELYDMAVGWKNYTAKNSKFYNTHKGQRCFIIGNGPSLTIGDLNKLKGEITFACNSIYAVYDCTDWRPTYFCAWDEAFCETAMSNMEDIMHITDGCKAAFTGVSSIGFNYRDELNNLFFVAPGTKYINEQKSYFSDDICEQVYPSGNITYVMLQIAAYMGFEEIYLLGMDFNYSYERQQDGSITHNDVTNHMGIIEDEDKKGQDIIISRYGVPYVADVYLQLRGYQAAKEYADNHGIKIYNATRGGKLEVFERVDFDSLFT